MKQQSIYLLIIATIAVVLSDDSICCPKIKEEWCDSECYQCTQHDVDVLATEQIEFDKFMDILYEFDDKPTKMDIVNCTTGERVPSFVEYNVDKANTRNQLYLQYYLPLSECADCKINATPEKYSKCSVRMRKTMGRNIKSIIVYIDTKLKQLAEPHKEICDKLPIY